MTEPQYADLLDAARLLSNVTEVTPMAHSRWLAELTGSPVYLKCENLQRTGSFKVRGAYVRMSRLVERHGITHVVAASAGNHAQGVALAARTLGIEATIFMPHGAAIPKVQATSGYGATVEFAGAEVMETIRAAEEFSVATGATVIHPFDHRDVIAGQGTVGLEIMEQLPEVTTILVPMGGGGLAAGVALLAEKYPHLRIVGVQAENASAYKRSLEAGQPLRVPTDPTMADGIAVAEPGQVPFDVCAKYLDDVIEVSEEALSRALIGLLERSKMLVEPAGAAAVAAVLADPDRFSGPTVPVLSGGNIDALLLLEVIRHGLASSGRFLKFRTRLPDRPGELMKLLAELTTLDVNILNILHDRGSEMLGVRQVEVSLQVATRGPEHREEVRAHLVDRGYVFEV